jgi:hypothetical protein
MTIDVPNDAAAAVAALIAKLNEHRAERPHEIRSIAESLGLCTEEYSELVRGVRKTDLNDPIDPVLNDLLELAMVSLSSFCDLGAAARGRSCVRCSLCRHRPGVDRRSLPGFVVCRPCAEAMA